MTPAQLTTLKADIAATPALASQPHNSDGAAAIAAFYNVLAAPAFWVWRTRVTQLEIVTTTTPAPDNTVWSWPAFIARTQGERDGWREMFADGAVNAALANVRQGFNDIFSGSTNSAPAQRTHLLTVGRRQASVVEKLLGTGTGSTAAPATMGFEGPLSGDDVQNAWNS